MNDYRELHELYHFGTDGMKWGRRRYQNEDGSYKPGAEGRYYDEVGDSRKGSKTKTESNKKSSNKSSSRSNEKKSNETADKVKHFVSSHKKEIAIGTAAVAGLAVSAIVLPRIASYYKAARRAQDDMINKGYNIEQPEVTEAIQKAINDTRDKRQNAAAAKKAVANSVHEGYKTMRETAKKAANAPEFKVTPNSTKAAVEAAKKAAQSAPRANTQTITKGAEDLARATKKQQDEAQKIINAVDSGSDYVNQLLKENEEMLKRIRNGGA